VKKIIALASMALAAGLTIAQSPAPTPKPNPPIPTESQAKFFKAQAEFLAAQSSLNAATEKLPEYKQYQDKQGAFQAAVNEINASACKGAGLTLDPKGDLACRPEEPKPSAKPAEPAKK
jgi:hypothetical protein